MTTSPPKQPALNAGLGSDIDPAGAVIRVTPAQLLAALTQGEVDAHGLLPYSSNYNFLVTVVAGDMQVPAVYKPRRGESPLWDFAQGSLCLRERAAFVVSDLLGWDQAPHGATGRSSRVGQRPVFCGCPARRPLFHRTGGCPPRRDFAPHGPL